MPTISKQLRQAYELQDITFNLAKSLYQQAVQPDGSVKASKELAQAVNMSVNSWYSCQERISFHRRVPNPGSLRPAAKERASKLGKWLIGPISAVQDAKQLPSPPAPAPDKPSVEPSK